MQTRFYIPHPLLQEFVQCIMLVHAEIDPEVPAVLCPYPPTPQNSLFFYINDRIKVQQEGTDTFILQPRSVIVGPQLNRVTIDINRDHKAVRVGLHPGGLHRLLGLSMAEMIDGSYDAEDVFGNEMNELNEKMQEANSFDAIKDVVELFLLKKAKSLKDILPFDKAMLELLRVEGNVSIEKLASMACLSLRQFERVSKERIGLPPKLFSRIVRFSKAYRLKEQMPGISWTKIAYECNYFDQMHLIRDFKQFAGVAPGVIEKELGDTPVRLQASLRL
ncbi:helix-turn-helix domain-containing protein [Lacibacter sediminis]|uniref:AraC family transcriptional regulator n=1 Tax=Lacibacter sediminis TaxID=2760713 RepID=A0A7G5XCF3_9BACT|nr:helix-turn-helix domain-containing protein [Lacibacter sediminis]QNA43156.1 AraC family transcriptional regulator [Lacibacter sediminis]